MKHMMRPQPAGARRVWTLAIAASVLGGAALGSQTGCRGEGRDVPVPDAPSFAKALPIAPASARRHLPPKPGARLVAGRAVDVPVPVHFGAMDVARRGDIYLVLSTHVNVRKLVALSAKTGAEVWRAPFEVTNLYLHEDRVILEHAKGGVSAHRVKDGAQVWSRPDVSLSWKYRVYGVGAEDNHELGGEELLVTGAKDQRVDPRTGEPLQGAAGKPAPSRAYLPIRVVEVPAKASRLAPRGFTHIRRADAKVPGVLIAGVQLRRGAARTDALWSVDRKAWTMHLTTIDHVASTRKHTSWPIPRREGEGAFNGLPNPQKLEARVRVLRDHIALVEDYSRYRWSWGRGNNRLTLLDARGQKQTQAWGQAPADPPGAYHGWRFSGDEVYLSDGIFHAQDPPQPVRYVTPAKLGQPGAYSKPGAPVHRVHRLGAHRVTLVHEGDAQRGQTIAARVGGHLQKLSFPKGRTLRYWTQPLPDRRGFLAFTTAGKHGDQLRLHPFRVVSGGAAHAQ